MKKFLAVTALPLLVLMLIVGVTHSALKPPTAICHPRQLQPCWKPIRLGIPPPPLCCTRLKKQRSCMCGYFKNPKIAKFWRSPNAKKVAKACLVRIPRCKIIP
ncbi:hypothetical protein M8C21_010600 [Ambrosia artemisiifolia]|uniref:Bifunctional inhibitor/plant lipid transfer protein/seed storage helical domain-containing protein n=1 Tax=Ambrosia artemisiifolia TaxID=4212 RepID=A0AAD5DBJ0_AMBAR|nr:hypothetical protein M8C21_010600 [Ambrosia artemisiifolia]